jgi:hypothetical protein
MSPIVGDSRLEVDATRARQTEKPTTPFRDVLAGGVSLLMSGAEVATHVVAGPVLAAAVHDARIGTVTAIGGPGAAGGGVPTVGGVPGGPGSIAAVGPGSLGAPQSPGTGAGGSSDLGNVQAMMQDGQTSNMQMLALQQEIQEQSQQFTTVSNVMRAKYDTAKAAISNIRA